MLEEVCKVVCSMNPGCWRGCVRYNVVYSMNLEEMHSDMQVRVCRGMGCVEGVCKVVMSLKESYILMCRYGVCRGSFVCSVLFLCCCSCCFNHDPVQSC